jgi:cytochrome c oxidase assembly factor CtaG
MVASSGWGQASLSVALLAAYAVPYTLRARTLRRRGRPVPGWRQACFWAAVVVLIIAVNPVMGDAADRRLSMHMLEHVLIGDVAPLLVVLGLTGPLLAPLLRIPVVARLRSLNHPVAAVCIWLATLYVWHLRVAYEAAVRNDVVHVLEHASFFAAGLNLWLALLGPLPKPAWFGTGARLAYVIAVSVTGSALAYVFIWADTPLFPIYGTAGQGAAGGVMLLIHGILIIGLLGWLLWRAIQDAGRRQELAERAAAAGVTLAPQRIARAVAADGGRALAERVESGERFVD